MMKLVVMLAVSIVLATISARVACPAAVDDSTAVEHAHESPEQLLKWCLMEAPKYWEAHKHHFDGYEITVRVRSEYLTVRKEPHDWITRVTISQSGDSVLLEGVISPTPGDRRWILDGANPLYSFRLRADGAGEPTTRRVEYVRAQNFKGATSADLIRRSREFASGGLQLLDIADQRDVPMLLAAEHFHAERAHIDVKAGARLLIIDFSYKANA